MRLQRKPERWQCVPTSFAIALDMPVKALLDELGHDGGEVLWQETPGPVGLEGRRGFHIQELIDLCLKRGLAVTPIEFCPMLRDVRGRTYAGHHLSDHNRTNRFYDMLCTTRGVLEGQGAHCGHMVAYDRGHIYDPDGYEYAWFDFDLRGFQPLCVWRIDAILLPKERS